MYETILVPLDGSKRAQRILPYVEELALNHSSTVILMQVIEPTLNGPDIYHGGVYIDYEFAGKLALEAKTYLLSLVRKMREKGIAAKSVVDFGPVVRTILDVAEREKADLIAMASHGRTGVARVFYGSVAAGVLQQADRPLLLIRAEQTQ